VFATPAVRAAEDLDDLQEKAIKAAVAQVAPCVVQIETSGGTEVLSTGPAGLIRRGVGPTSGLVVSPDGYIISSAFNFAGKPQAIRIAVPGHKERYVARVVAHDHTRMLTLLKIDLEGNTKLPVPEAAPKAGVKIGHTALAVGRTLAATVESPPSVSVGIVSALERIWGKAIQTDAKVSPTNYGGPLVDLHGRVIGVLVPASPRADGETAGFEWYDSGIGFAIPLEDINRVLPRMKAGTEKNQVTLRRGMLGITMQQGPEPYGLPATVASVGPGSAAEKLGIKPGDVITKIAGKPIATQAQLHHQLGFRYEGDVVSVEVTRDKKPITFEKVVLGGEVAAYGQPFLGILPIRDDPNPGVEVRYVYPKSPAEKAGIKAGDRLMKIGLPPMPGMPVPQAPITGRDMLLAFLSTTIPGLDLSVEVKRKDGGKTETLTVKLAEAPATVPDKLPDRSSAKKALVKPGMPAEKKDEKKEEKKEDKKDDKKEDKKAPTGFIKRTTAAGDHTYWIFVPTDYDPNVAYGVVIWLHPTGKNREKDFDNLTWAWEPSCEDHHFIMICPKTDNERGWTQGEAEFVLETLQAVSDAYTIDRQRIVVHGMGLGGEMAYYLGFHARNVVRGVATVGAALTSNPREKLANQPLSFYLVAGDKDPLKDAIAESRGKLAEHKYSVILREVENLGHQYIDGRAGIATMEELVRWIDSLDRM
jgi:S1-C subfamily serine protease/predicted esterase